MSRIVATCGCGRIYDDAAWKALHVDGIQSIPFGGGIELRRCKCESTIAVCSTCGSSMCGCRGCGSICGESHDVRCAIAMQVSA